MIASETKAFAWNVKHKIFKIKSIYVVVAGVANWIGGAAQDGSKNFVPNDN